MSNKPKATREAGAIASKSALAIMTALAMLLSSCQTVDNGTLEERKSLISSNPESIGDDNAFRNYLASIKSIHFSDDGDTIEYDFTDLSGKERTVKKTSRELASIAGANADKIIFLTIVTFQGPKPLNDKETANVTSWIERGAELGDPRSRHFDALLDYKGIGGRTADKEKAIKVWEELAKEGETQSVIRLALMKLLGVDVQCDVDEAKTLLAKVGGGMSYFPKRTLSGCGKKRSCLYEKMKLEDKLEFWRRLSAKKDRESRKLGKIVKQFEILDVEDEWAMNPVYGPMRDDAFATTNEALQKAAAKSEPKKDVKDEAEEKTLGDSVDGDGNQPQPQDQAQQNQKDASKPEAKQDDNGASQNQDFEAPGLLPGQTVNINESPNGEDIKEGVEDRMVPDEKITWSFYDEPVKPKAQYRVQGTPQANPQAILEGGNGDAATNRGATQVFDVDDPNAKAVQASEYAIPYVGTIQSAEDYYYADESDPNAPVNRMEAKRNYQTAVAKETLELLYPYATVMVAPTVGSYEATVTTEYIDDDDPNSEVSRLAAKRNYERAIINHVVRNVELIPSDDPNSPEARLAARRSYERAILGRDFEEAQEIRVIRDSDPNSEASRRAARRSYHNAVAKEVAKMVDADTVIVELEPEEPSAPKLVAKPVIEKTTVVEVEPEPDDDPNSYEARLAARESYQRAVAKEAAKELDAKASKKAGGKNAKKAKKDVKAKESAKNMDPNSPEARLAAKISYEKAVANQVATAIDPNAHAVKIVNQEAKQPSTYAVVLDEKDPYKEALRLAKEQAASSGAETYSDKDPNAAKALAGAQKVVVKEVVSDEVPATVVEEAQADEVAIVETPDGENKVVHVTNPARVSFKRSGTIWLPVRIEVKDVDE